VGPTLIFPLGAVCYAARPVPSPSTLEGGWAGARSLRERTRPVDLVFISRNRLLSSSQIASGAAPAVAPVAATGAPSGIAQLRKSVDQQASQQPPQHQQHQQQPAAAAADPMNLDDFIFPSSVASPAGLSPSPSAVDLPSSSHPSTLLPSSAQGIPIRKQAALEEQDSHLLRASAPSVPPAVRHDPEFGYVQRHVRKTSIDERRVSLTSSPFPGDF
jgi:GATA-binding protein, other eukaryote